MPAVQETIERVKSIDVDHYKYGFKTTADVFARLSPNSTRSLMLSQRRDLPAAGRVTTDIRGKGECE